MTKNKSAKIVPFDYEAKRYKQINPNGETLTIKKLKTFSCYENISDEEANFIVTTLIEFSEIISNYLKAVEFKPDTINEIQLNNIKAA